MLKLTAPLASLAGGSPVVADITEGLPAVSTSTDQVYSAPIDLDAGTYAFEVRVTSTGASSYARIFTIRLTDPTGAEVMRYIVPAMDTWRPPQAVVFHTTVPAPGAYRISMQPGDTSAMYSVGHIDRIRVIRLQPTPLVVGTQIGKQAYGPLRDWALSIGKTYETITEIPMPIKVAGPSLQSLFYGCSALTSIPDMDTRQVTDMSLLFSGCSALTVVPELDTIKNTTMFSMFKDCSSLTSLPDMDTSKVTTMSGAFYGCSALTSIPDMDTSQVTTTASMFMMCTSLTNVPSLDTSQVTSTTYMFYGCSSLESVTLPGMGDAFTDAQALDMVYTKLNAAAANALMESLGTPTPGGNLRLPTTSAGANIGIAEAKNWTVTIG